MSPTNPHFQKTVDRTTVDRTTARTVSSNDSYYPTLQDYPEGDPEALRRLAQTEEGRKRIAEKIAADELVVREKEEQLAKLTRDLSQLTPPSVEPALRHPAQEAKDVDTTLETPVQETGTTTGDSPKKVQRALLLPPLLL